MNFETNSVRVEYSFLSGVKDVQQRLSNLRELFLDPNALERRIRDENDALFYEQYAVSHNQDFFPEQTLRKAERRAVEFALS